MKVENILQLIGNTPHLRLAKLFPNNQVWLKIEANNPGGSIKDRVALSMIKDAEQRGVLLPDTTIIEPTSGNTGIGLAMIAAVKNYKLIIVMPESMSIERRKSIEAYGAKIVLTPKELGMAGAINRAEELNSEISNSWIPMQFINSANPNAHRVTTVKEISNDFKDGLDYMVAGVGTGGHITGVGEELRKEFPNLKIVAVEPDNSAVLSGENSGTHKIQGIGAGFIPQILNVEQIDKIIQVSNEEAYQFTDLVSKVEGVSVGISTGANLAAVNKIVKELDERKVILTFAYDSRDRYLSVL